MDFDCQDDSFYNTGMIRLSVEFRDRQSGKKGNGRHVTFDLPGVDQVRVREDADRSLLFKLRSDRSVPREVHDALGRSDVFRIRVYRSVFGSGEIQYAGALQPAAYLKSFTASEFPDVTVVRDEFPAMPRGRGPKRWLTGVLTAGRQPIKKHHYR